MGRLKATLLTLAMAALATTALSACGGDSPDLLPGETAREINANLNLVEELVAQGDCIGASNAAAAIGEQVENLGGVDQELKEALSKGAARLSEVVTQCDEEASEEETTSPTELEDEEREEEQREKEEKAAEKEAEKEQKKEEKEAPPAESPGQEKNEPPGQEKKEEEAPQGEQGDGGTPSGGVAPSAPVEGE